MNPTIEELLLRRPVVTDGAWGTQLQARGLPIGGCPDAWNLQYPDRVEEVARAYVDAGSRVILTNTFGANRYTLERHGLADRVAEVNRAGAAISCQAASGRARVFASVGPTGKMLAMGDVSPDEVRAAFAEQTQALAEGGADGFVVETMSDLDEARLAVEAARGTGLPVVACLVFDSGQAGDRTMMGNTPEQTAEVLGGVGADVIGSNCGKGPVQMLAICQRLRAATALPLWMKPNAGMPKLVEGRAVYDMTAAEFAEAMRALVAAGADFVGGCCGTTPLLIESLAAAVNR